MFALTKFERCIARNFGGMCVCTIHWPFESKCYFSLSYIFFGLLFSLALFPVPYHPVLVSVFCIACCVSVYRLSQSLVLSVLLSRFLTSAFDIAHREVLCFFSPHLSPSSPSHPLLTFHLPSSTISPFLSHLSHLSHLSPLAPASPSLRPVPSASAPVPAVRPD